MNGAWVEAERVEEVRAAATGWRKARAIDSPTFEEISRRYPEPRTSPALLWRALVSVLVSFVLLLLAGAFLAAVSPALRGAWALCAFFGAAFLALAETQARSPSLALRGGVGAASFWGICALVAGLFFLLEENLRLSKPAGPNLVLAGAAVLFALAAFRWGIPVFAGFSGAAFFVLLARAPQGRLLWVAAGVAVAAFAERFLDRPSWAPSHRASAAVVAACGIAAVYAAVNLWSLDHSAVEALCGPVRRPAAPSAVEREAAIAGTALVPALVLVAGVRARRRIFLDLGLVLAALSLVTLRFYVHVAALWVVLSAAGTALVLAALAVNRWLSRGPAKERGGFTAEPLFEDVESFRAAELAPVLAGHAPGARPPGEPGFRGGGGSFGGGGAGGSF